MQLTPDELKANEEDIFHDLVHTPGDKTLLNQLYRDGVPSPEAYLAQRIRVLFVFREPNLLGKAGPHDMRDEVRDPRFRPLAPDGTREDRSERGWWNRRAGLFAHAVAAALDDDEPSSEAFARFWNGGWNHEVVNRFAYIQIKKVGGGGRAKTHEICEHAAKFAPTLKRQVGLYRPHLVLGCGLGPGSPARLLVKHILDGAPAATAGRTGLYWWQFSATGRPRAMVELRHPASRGSRSELYGKVLECVREVVQETGLASRQD